MHKSVMAAGALSQVERDFIRDHHMVAKYVFRIPGPEAMGWNGIDYRLVHSRSGKVLASAPSKPKFKSECEGLMTRAVFNVLFRKRSN